MYNEKNKYFINNILNLVGLRCPEPIMLIGQLIRNMESGQVLLIITDDPSSRREISNFCKFLGHVLLEFYVDQLPYRYLLCKG